MQPSKSTDIKHKRIVILCDGTGQSASRGDESVSTNVNRIGRALSHEDHAVQQLIYYQSGIGSHDVDSFSKTVAGGLGLGLEDNVLDAYTFIMNNYKPGDELFIFGFSRGAFTARVLANFVARIGVFRKPNYARELKDAWSAYCQGHVNFEEHLKKLALKSQNCAEHDPMYTKATIKVLGCWDTVASVGFPNYMQWVPGTKEYHYLDGSLVEGIEHAFHALALDECRYPFSPTMFFMPIDEATAKGIKLRQTWFAGAHTNVGGGYPDRAIANTTLAWMIDCCHGLLDFMPGYINNCVALDHGSQEPRKDAGSSWRLGKLFKRGQTDRDYDLEYQGWGNGMIYDSYKQGSTYTWYYRSPGDYERWEKKTVGPTHERIHASVRARWNADESWRPKALKGFEPKERENGSWVWVKVGEEKTIILEEEPFTTNQDSFEWKLRYDFSAKQ